MNVFMLWVSVVAATITNGAFYYVAFSKSGFNLFFSGAITLSFMSSEIAYWYSPDITKKVQPGFIMSAIGKKEPYQKKQFAWLLLLVKILLLVYSIHTTQAGQFFNSSANTVEIQSTLNVRKNIEQNLSDLQSDRDTYSQENLTAELQPLYDQLKIVNDQLTKYIDLQNKFGTEQNRSDRESTEREKQNILNAIGSIRSRYETERSRIDLEITALREERKDETVTEAPRTSYDFYADRYRIDKELVMMISQLFAACILAFIAPVSLTILKNLKTVKPEARKDPVGDAIKNLGYSEEDVQQIKDEFQRSSEKLESEIERLNIGLVQATHRFEKAEGELKQRDNIPVLQKKEPPVYKEPNDPVKPDIIPTSQSNTDRIIKKNIIKILFKNIEEPEGRILTPEQCIKEFEIIKKNYMPSLYIPSKKEILSVLKEIMDAKLVNTKSVKEVIRRIVK